jgi:phosphonatase-like hydrolase
MGSVSTIKLAVFDVAGTTAHDDGLVVEAFQNAMILLGAVSGSSELANMTEYVNATMGQRKIDVFTHLYEGDAEKANTAHDRFIESYISLIQQGKLKEFDGITPFFDQLRTDGVAVSITTGFPREILQPIIDGLNWVDHIDFSVAASEVAHGRPAPDMIFKSMELYNQKFNTEISPGEVAVIGDTESDMKSGVAAGAAIIAGVTSGAGTSEQLFATGATHVLECASDLSTIC